MRLTVTSEKEKESIRNTISRAWGSQAVEDFIKYFLNKNWTEDEAYFELGVAQAFEMGEWFAVPSTDKYKYPEDEYDIIETISKTGEGMLICQERLDMWEEIAPGIRRRKKGYIYER